MSEKCSGSFPITTVGGGVCSETMQIGPDDPVLVGGELNVGWCRVIRPLGRGPVSDRWLAVNERLQSSHVVHRIHMRSDGLARRRFLAAAESVSRISHPHVLPIDFFTLAGEDRYHVRGVIVTPYTGANPGVGVEGTGLVTIGSLAEMKGGSLGEIEVDRAARQMLGALDAAHARGVLHGALSADEVLVDRFGKAMLELPGLKRAMSHHDDLEPAAHAVQVRREVTSVAELVFRLLTGRDPVSGDRARLGMRVSRFDPQWDHWLSRGLDPVGGFATPKEAIAALPSQKRDDEREEAEESSTIRVVLRSLLAPLVRRDD